MEQIFKSLLQKQGYEHIGVIDAEKKIWGYAKDGVFHFCKEDLTDVKRMDVGYDSGVLVLSVSDEKIRIVKNEECVSSSIIIDNSNKIIAEKKDSFHLLRINSESLVMVLEKTVRNYKVSNLQAPLFCKNFLNSIRSHLFFQIVIINGKIEKDYRLYMYHNSYYFFYIPDCDKELRETEYRATKVIDSNTQVIYEGEEPYVWIHKDNTLDIINISEKMVVDLISHSRHKRFDVREMMGNNRLQKSYDNDIYTNDNYNDDSVIFPFWENEGVFVINRTLSRVKLDKYKYYNYGTYCFYFEQGGKVKLYGNVIDVLIDEPYSPSEHFLYDIYGNYIAWYDVKTKEQYKIFCKYNNAYIENGDPLYGVIDLYDNKIVVPPIYENIKAVGGGYFEVSYKNNPLSDKECLTGVYCGGSLVVPLGIDFGYPQYHVSFSNQAKIVGLPFGIVYSRGNYKGLLMGSKVLDAKYDSIDGFSFYGDYLGEYITTSCFWEEKRNLEYSPRSVILSKNGLRGLFFINYRNEPYINVIEPQYETLTCCMLLEGHAYFEVRCGNKYGVISDSVKFNKISKCIYDKVEVEQRGAELVIKVFKDGKVGMISSNLNRSIPIKYNNLVILRKCYIGDGLYYSMKGIELLSQEEFVFIADGDYCQAYKNRKTNEYIFIRSNGDKLTYSKKGNANILEVKSPSNDDIYEFDIDKNSFIEEDDDSNDYYDYLREEEERRFYENEGYRDAYDGTPDAQWNTD